jgi:aspartyl-tRNA(Asn)/glutamyl-tRNA(Gln) amidotransferase subunit A
VSNLHALTIVAAGEMLAAREISAAELLEATLDRLAATEPRLHAYTEVFAAGARVEARRRDAGRAAADAAVGPLHGIPVAVKDAIEVEGAVMCAGSEGLPDRPAAADAPCVAALRGAGAVIVGLTDLPELALGLSSPETRNAWDPRRHPGGSSSGSAAAVAVGSAFAALGTDSGGSIRIPAAANGVVGLKPSRGVISNAGALPLSESLDTVGPIARTAEDCRIVFECLVGGAGVRADPMAGPIEERVGLDERLLEGDVDDEIAAAARAAIDGLELSGAEIVPIHMVDLGAAVDAAITSIQAEMAPGFRAPPDGRPDVFHPAVREFLDAGALLPAAAVRRARVAQEQITDELADLFGRLRLSALALPTFPQPPSPLDRQGRLDSDPASRRFVGGAIEYTTFANVAGLPAITVPCGFTDDLLPVGLQLVAPPRGEDILFRLGAAVAAPSSVATS